MGINKIVYNGGTLIDLTGDTVTADKLMQGYTAHDKSGEVIIGTATGGGGAVIQDENGGLHFLEDEVNAFSDAVTELPNGGFLHTITGVMASGGLEYEEGTWTPTEDVARPTINFINAHTARPFTIIFADTSNTPLDGYNQAWLFQSFIDGLASAMKGNTSGSLNYYARASYFYLGTGSTSITQGNNNITNLTDSSGSGGMGYWVTTTGFIPSSSATTRYWKAGRTYKWIAVWAPTT